MRSLGLFFVTIFSLQLVAQSSEKYTGPIIDMHVHAYTKENPLFGESYTNPLTGMTYNASTSLKTHQEETFEMFEKHNIVKAMVSTNEEWYKLMQTRYFLDIAIGIQ